MTTAINDIVDESIRLAIYCYNRYHIAIIASSPVLSHVFVSKLSSFHDDVLTEIIHADM